MDAITVDIWADVVCPWCYLGERRLRTALSLFHEEAPSVRVVPRWRPFQLQPHLPHGGIPWSDFATQTFGNLHRAGELFRHVEVASEGEDLPFHADRIASAPNTVDAHRLVLFATQNDRLWETVEALFGAYFAEGRDLNDEAHLIEAATAAGLDPDGARDYLRSDEGRAQVAQSQKIADRAGIRGVPLYIVHDRFALRGAQPANTLLRAFETILNEHSAE
jgi:predicted DsbA family dithiol-disulfide isomerase